MSIVNGRNVYIYSGSSGTSPIIAAAKSCKLNMVGELIEKASSTQSTAKEFLPGKTEWGISLNHLVVSDAPFDGIVKVNQTYTLRVVIGNTSKMGQAICTKADLVASVGNLATGSVEFKGTGALT